jgi:hypothetical protein
MLVNFRQGIVSYPVGFLQKVGTPTGSRVALNIPTDKPLTLHVAHRGANYIVVQKTSVGLTPPNGAFGPHLAGIDYWLYADINLTTGVLTWGNTTLEPVNQATTPTPTQTIISDASPTELVQIAGRHWFKTAPSTPTDDLLYPPYTMFVRNGGNTAWEEKVRVMLAKYEEASFFVSVSVNSGSPNTAVKFSGTQAGNLTSNNAGFLIYDSASVAFKNSDGTFVTTEDVLKTGMLLGADMKIGNYVVQGQAQSAFPAYTIVRFPTFGQVAPVNLFNIDQGLFGLVESSASIGQLVQVILEGVVTNSGWDWSQANAPLFIDSNGQLTETDPSVNDSEPVAFALSPTQILLRSSRVEVGLVDHATNVDFGAVRLDAAPTAVAGYLNFDYGGTLLGANPSGLVGTNTYTAEFLIGDVTKSVSVLGSLATTITDLITQLNIDLSPQGSAALVGGNIRVTSATAGPLSRVRVSDANIFESVTGFVEIDTPVDGYYDSVVASASGLATHIADAAVHLTADENTFLDLLVANAGVQPANTVVLVGRKDNGSSLKVRGPQAPSEGGAEVSSYSGIFYDDGFNITGTKKTKFITGGNIEMDVEIQSPHQLRLIGNDNSQTDGQVWIASHTNVKITAHGGDSVNARRLIIDRVDKVNYDDFNTSNVEISVSAGQLVFASVPVLPTYLTTGLPPVAAGGVIFVSNAAGGAGRIAYGNTAAAAWIDPQTGIAVAV